MSKEQLHIFLIDDNDIDIVVNSKLLKLARITDHIHTFSSCQQAMLYFIKNAEELKSSRVVLLLDIQMPEMNGFECMQKFEELPEELRSAMKVYMLSSSIDRNDIRRAEEHPHIEKILEKPLDVYQLKRYLSV